ncbi:cell adhesion molecule 3 isoform X1 [Chelmon rostratus]|uniref:cell adhesion molecule 3 isoform X1 n=1 Tax=Chelmon rostratus TaxID=109905 RepID=UPI001BECD61B|nr:cell adhesion molecule 3 isoform X1 [Chelmon rostratus]
MEAVVGLLLMLLAVCHGVETSCDGRQDGAQCYGALGGTVVLQLMDNASEIFKFQWSNKTTRILNWRSNKIVSNQIGNRSSFTPSNGTFMINDLSRTDGGDYTLIMFDSDGKPAEQRALQLTIQAPVSSVLLDSECLSQGEMRVSCSSEGGDSPQYSWTLDGQTLTDAQLLSGSNESENITLRQDVSGQLVCSVRNHISSVSEEETISTCGFIFIDCILSNGTHVSQWVLEASNTLCIKPTTASTTTTEGKEPSLTVSNTSSTNITFSSPTVTLPSTDEPWFIRYSTIMAGVLSALLILLIVGVAVVCAHKKKQNNKPQEKEDEQELTYADVNIVQRHRRQMQQRAETEVEYGQVKFSQAPRRTVEPAGDDCVYSVVRKGR